MFPKWSSEVIVIFQAGYFKESKGEAKLFQGCLCIVVKDVGRDAIRDVNKEFQDKLGRIVSAGGERNFITQVRHVIFILNSPTFSCTKKSFIY